MRMATFCQHVDEGAMYLLQIHAAIHSLVCKVCDFSSFPHVLAQQIQGIILENCTYMHKSARSI